MPAGWHHCSAVASVGTSGPSASVLAGADIRLQLDWLGGSVPDLTALRRLNQGRFHEKRNQHRVRAPLAIRHRPGRKTIVTPTADCAKAGHRARRPGIGEGAGARFPLSSRLGSSALFLDDQDGNPEMIERCNLPQREHISGHIC